MATRTQLVYPKYDLSPSQTPKIPKNSPKILKNILNI
uniref:Uncharacterized protein n=1 Tax=Setaria viridis TaxID=4556 RepID=A0A4U6U522_SETVI|nr:hypothetical protein SEVIR_6G028366v2 [Setaria viridis]